MDIEDFKTTRFNIVGANSKISGELHLDGPTTICGSMNGTIHTTSRLVLDRNSNMLGTIKGHDVEITGRFQGEIQCTGTLSLRAGSEVTGIINAAKLVIYPGATVDMEGSADATHS
mgnify:CR=1 FL=1